jgi:hypothetical protein
LANFAVHISEPPNGRALAKLRKCRDRLNAKAASVGRAAWSVRALASGPRIPAVYVRNEFVDMALSGVQLRGDPSDRRLSVKEDRPPAARLITPRGGAPRFP